MRPRGIVRLARHLTRKDRSPSAGDAQRQQATDGERAIQDQGESEQAERTAARITAKATVLLYEFQKDGIPARPLDHPLSVARAWHNG
jgi:hypothetical protein